MIRATAPLLPTSLFLSAGLLLGSAGPATAQEPATAGSAPATMTTEEVAHALDAPRATAVRTAGPVSLDGRVDEAVWFQAPAITEFTQLDPDEGAPPSLRSEVRILYDDEALYIGATLDDAGGAAARLARRDALVPDADYFTVSLDSYHDHGTAYTFSVNPSGQKRDAVIRNAGFAGDTSWDPVWSAATAVTGAGWSVEMRIPFSQLRFSTAEVQEWGIQIERIIRRLQENLVFAFTPKLEQGGVPRYGHLEGIRGIDSGRRLELLPYVAGQAEFIRGEPGADANRADPYRAGTDYFGNAGVDLAYGLTSNLTLNGTVNPDFGQVEVDPAVINLTDFETRFEERRPFFVEGADIFSYGRGGPGGNVGGTPDLLYSRRIGGSAHGEAPSAAEFSDTPVATTILGAAKLTGRTEDGWSVGVLEAVTERETGVWSESPGTRRASVVEPATNFFVGRIRRDIRGGRTSFGGIASAVNRRLGDAGLLGDVLHGSAYSAGLDLNHEWAERTWRLSAALAGSRVAGTRAALLRTQRSSARYFGRPDAEHVEVDPDATSMAGYYAMAGVEKQAGAFQVRVTTAAVSPGYEVNDIGFQARADRLILDTTLRYQETVPGRVFRSWEIRGGPDAIWNTAGDRLFAEFNFFGFWQLLNYWGGGWRFGFNPATDDDELTRGGPLARTPRGYYANFNVESDQTRRLSGSASYQGAFDEGDSWRHRFDLGLSYRDGERWEVSLGPALTRRHTTAQYVTAVADPVADHTFGRRYIFASLDQTTVSLDTRLNVTFTPTLSLEIYAQPFLSSGAYADPKELRAQGTFEFLTYGEDAGTAEHRDGKVEIDPDGGGPANAFTVQDPDFNFRSLLGNAVLRWEWRPGSTLFLVWQQSRTGRVRRPGTAGSEPGGIGDFDLRRDSEELFRIRPDNIFLLKVNYWFNL
ncbi:MAG: DUF5916 domain-containing protein [Gammaproteobacteria bacterium]|nr:DUF5916 domain-containing protein [Gammaproteobacteria bacterium]